MRHVAALAAIAMGTLGASADAQTLGTFRWQLQPFCNVISVTVVQQGAQYHVDGTDDQCGAARQASVVGRAFPNPDGSIGFGLTTVTTSGAAPIHLDARLSVATLGGSWTDSAGNSGTFVFSPAGGSGGSPRPVPPGGIAPGTITGAQLAAGTITAAQLAPGAVSGAVGALGVCPPGQSLRGFTAGGPICDPVTLPPTTTVVDAGPALTGYYPSIALGADGVPIISHYDATNQDLRVTHCSNPSCTASSSISVDTAGNVGTEPSIAIGADGLPIISHYDSGNQDLRVTHCNTVTCSAATSTTVDTTGNVGRGSSIAIGADGLAIIAHWDAANRALRVTHCADVPCTSASSTTIATDRGYNASIAIGANGRALVSYQNDTEVRVAYCADVSCSSATSVTVAAAPLGADSTALMVGVDGIPTIAWADDNSESHVTRCADAGCTSAQTFPIGVLSRVSGTLGGDGLPVVSGGGPPQGRQLYVAHCEVGSCQTLTRVPVDAGADVGLDSSVSIGRDGLPVVAYLDATNNDLRVAKCNSRSCQ